MTVSCWLSRAWLLCDNRRHTSWKIPCLYLCSSRRQNNLIHTFWSCSSQILSILRPRSFSIWRTKFDGLRLPPETVAVLPIIYEPGRCELMAWSSLAASFQRVDSPTWVYLFCAWTIFFRALSATHWKYFLTSSRAFNNSSLPYSEYFGVSLEKATNWI